MVTEVTEPQDSRLATRAPENANLGVFRPPLIYLASIVTGLAIHKARPQRLVVDAQAGLLGSSLTVVSILLFASAVKSFRTAGTPVQARKPTTALVRTGPYRFSRNPIYLAFSLFQLGIAIGVSSWWLIATLAGAVAIIHFVVIPREEQYLETRFGAQYLDYKAAVRRWF